MINRYAKPLILLLTLACIAMLAVGLYLQLVLEMLPCPLCILQRYAFAATAVICLITLFLPTALLRAGADGRRHRLTSFVGKGTSDGLLRH